MIGQNYNINAGGRLIDLTKPIVMSILNVTPDSFYDGGSLTSEHELLKRVEKELELGASIFDIGGMSSRPGADFVPVEEELNRVIPAINAIRSSFPDAILSIDTIHAEVAQSALEAGASIVNDISGGTHDDQMIKVCAQFGSPFICMHMQGNPKNMQNLPTYKNVTLDILSILKHRIVQIKKQGVKDIIIDPGFGFGKSIDHNYQLLDELSAFKILESPILIGISRKSMIYKPLNSTPKEALNGTSALHMIALERGANILRVHDVKEAIECVKLHQLLKG